MWRMLQQDQPDDYVVATAETHSVREFAKLAFQYAGLDYEKYVVTDPQLYRPAEVDLLVGNPAKARERLGWSSSVPLAILGVGNGGIGLPRAGHRARQRQLHRTKASLLLRGSRR